MEHRLFRRFPANHPVDIYQGHQCIVQGRACNVSREGAMLEADDGPLPRYGPVELELKFGTADVVPRRIRGLVVYRDDRKLGVMFIDEWSQSEWQSLTASCNDVGRPSLPAARH